MKAKLETIYTEPDTLFRFMRGRRKPVFHNSNIFFRDIQFSIQDYANSALNQNLSSDEAFEAAEEFVRWNVNAGILRPVGPQAYLLWDPKYLTPKGGTMSLMNVAMAELDTIVTQTVIDDDGDDVHFEEPTVVS